MKLLILLSLAVAFNVVNSQRYSPYYDRDSKDMKKREVDEGYYNQDDSEVEESEVQKRDYDDDFEADLEAKDTEKRAIYDNDFSNFESLEALKRKKRQEYGNGFYEAKDVKKRGYNYEDLSAKEVDKRWLYW